eukprot:scaffold23.g4176.t1
MSLLACLPTSVAGALGRAARVGVAAAVARRGSRAAAEAPDVLAGQHLRGAATSAASDANTSRDVYDDDDYADSGEYVPPGPKDSIHIWDDAEDLAARSRQSDAAYADEYPDSGEWVPVPGGTAQTKWWEWKQAADEAMRGGRPPPGVSLD